MYRQRGEISLTLALLGIFVSVLGIGLGTISVNQNQSRSASAQMLPGDYPYRSILVVTDTDGNVVNWVEGMRWTNEIEGGSNPGTSEDDIKEPGCTGTCPAQLTWNTGSVPQPLRGATANVNLYMPEGYEIVEAHCTSSPRDVCENTSVVNDGPRFSRRANISIQSGADITYGIVVRRTGDGGEPDPDPDPDPTAIPDPDPTVEPDPDPTACQVQTSGCRPTNVDIDQVSEHNVTVTWDYPPNCPGYDSSQDRFWVDVVRTGSPDRIVCATDSGDNEATCTLGRSAPAGRQIDTGSDEYRDKKWDEGRRYLVNVFLHDGSGQCVSTPGGVSFVYEGEDDEQEGWPQAPNRQPPGPAAGNQQMILSPVADSMINERKQNENYGDKIGLFVGYDSDYDDEEAYFKSILKFDLRNLPRNAQIHKATLRSYLAFATHPKGDKNFGIDLFRYQDTSWRESAVTWNNTHHAGNSYLSTTEVDADSFYTMIDFNIPSNQFSNWLNNSFDTDGGLYSLWLARSERENQNNVRAFMSKEFLNGSRAPQLVIEYSTDGTGGSSDLVCSRKCIYSEDVNNDDIPECYEGACPANRPDCGGDTPRERIENGNKGCEYAANACGPQAHKRVSCQSGEPIGGGGGEPDPEPEPGGDVITLDVIEDAYVSTSNPSENYGDEILLRMGPRDGDTFYSLLKFPISSQTKAQIKEKGIEKMRVLFSPASASSSPNISMDMTNILNWDEDSLTYNGLPNFNTYTEDARFQVDENYRTYWEYTDSENFQSFFEGQGVDEVSFLASSEGTYGDYYSREGAVYSENLARKPQLQIYLGSGSGSDSGYESASIRLNNPQSNITELSACADELFVALTKKPEGAENPPYKVAFTVIDKTILSMEKGSYVIELWAVSQFDQDEDASTYLRFRYENIDITEDNTLTMPDFSAIPPIKEACDLHGQEPTAHILYAVQGIETGEHGVRSVALFPGSIDNMYDNDRPYKVNFGDKHADAQNMLANYSISTAQNPATVRINTFTDAPMNRTYTLRLKMNKNALLNHAIYNNCDKTRLITNLENDDLFACEFTPTSGETEITFRVEPLAQTSLVGRVDRSELAEGLDVTDSQITICNSSGDCEEVSDATGVGSERVTAGQLQDLDLEDGKYSLSCDVTLSNGQTYACPETEGEVGNPLYIVLSGADASSVNVEVEAESERADLNKDEVVSTLDIALLLDSYLTPDADIDGDGKTNAIDYSIQVAWLGKGIFESGKTAVYSSSSQQFQLQENGAQPNEYGARPE